MSKNSTNFLSAEDVKNAAQGRWREILSSASGIPSDRLDGKGHPCPKCGGTDRFALVDAAAGAVHCRKCFSQKIGDGLAAIAWMLGCSFPDAIKKVADHLGLKATATNGQPHIAATYDYRDETGKLVFQAVRLEPKDFRQRKPKPDGSWEWSVKGVRVVPYRLPELLAAPTRVVFIVEGEKDVDNLARIEVTATCNAGGAGKWSADHTAFLRGRRVVILPDNDEPGARHAQQVALSLQGVASSVRMLHLPDLPPKGDVSDWLASGGTKEMLRDFIKGLPEWTPPPVAQPWSEIVSFDMVDLPEFPTEVLPAVLQCWVMAQSQATQTPPDLAALLALAVCGAAIARFVVVQPRCGWREPVNLFVAVLLDPGNRKSAVFAEALRPLRKLEEELIEAARPEVARAQSRRRMREKEGKKAEEKAASGKNPQAALRAQEIAAELATEPEPVLPRLIVDDATSEKLGIMLADQEGRIASMSPEGGVFDLMAGLYSKSGMPQFGVYLMGHSGDDLVTDRVSRKSIYVPRPALTCAYAMQPQVIEGVAENAAFRGRGLLARFLYAAPVSWIGAREIAPPPVPDELHQAYQQLVRSLFEDVHDCELTLSPGAATRLHSWEAELEQMLAEGGELELMRDWGAKLAGATIRLAGVLHCIEHGLAGSIQEATLASAIAIARYLVPHAEAVLSKMEATEGETYADAQYVLRWIVRKGLPHFTKREAQHHGKRRFPKAEDIDNALAELMRRNYIRPRPVLKSGAGRPPSPVFDVNPAVFPQSSPDARSQNSQNPPEVTIADNCGNNGSAPEQIAGEERLEVKI